MDRDRVTVIPAQLNHHLDQISAELAEGNTKGSNEGVLNAVPNKASRERRLVIQSTETKHVAKHFGPREVMQHHTDNHPHHSVLASRSGG